MDALQSTRWTIVAIASPWLWALLLQLIDNGYGCDGSIDQILECGGNLNLANNFGHTPLHLAARHGDAITASFLLFKGASVHAMDQVIFSTISMAITV